MKVIIASRVRMMISSQYAHALSKKEMIIRRVGYFFLGKQQRSLASSLSSLCSSSFNHQSRIYIDCYQPKRNSNPGSSLTYQIMFNMYLNKTSITKTRKKVVSIVRIYWSTPTIVSSIAMLECYVNYIYVLAIASRLLLPLYIYVSSQFQVDLHDLGFSL